MIKVYHNKNFLNIPSWKWGTEVKPEIVDLKWVATVDTDDLNAAFEKTNHIDCAWEYNEEVSSCLIKQRSTSCGDVLIHGDKAYVVAAVGFVEIDNLY
ncbi:MAG: hypothetical protein WC503_00805 [Candidatus Shapirobacteria bacterium]